MALEFLGGWVGGKIASHKAIKNWLILKGRKIHLGAFSFEFCLNKITLQERRGYLLATPWTQSK